MSPHRITATSGFWEHPLTNTRDLGTVEPPARTFAAIALPYCTKLPLNAYDASMAEQMSVWLRKHGRVGDQLPGPTKTLSCMHTILVSHNVLRRL